MNKILRYILFRTVLVIITLHTVIPHPHSDELTNEEHFEIHQKSDFLIGIIRLVFHESNDENLDNLIYAKYKSVKNTNFKNPNSNPNIPILNDLRFGIKERKTEKKVSLVINDFKKIFFAKLNSLNYS